MVLQQSGKITMTDICTEFSVGKTAVGLSSSLAGKISKTANTTIKMSDFYGKSAYVPPPPPTVTVDTSFLPADAEFYLYHTASGNHVVYNTTTFSVTASPITSSVALCRFKRSPIGSNVWNGADGTSGLLETTTNKWFSAATSSLVSIWPGSGDSNVSWKFTFDTAGTAYRIGGYNGGYGFNMYNWIFQNATGSAIKLGRNPTNFKILSIDDSTFTSTTTFTTDTLFNYTTTTTDTTDPSGRFEIIPAKFKLKSVSFNSYIAETFVYTTYGTLRLGNADEAIIWEPILSYNGISAYNCNKGYLIFKVSGTDRYLHSLHR